MKKFRKVLSCCMALSIFFTQTAPIYAEEITYQKTTDEDFKNETQVLAKIDSKYEVTIPKVIVLSGKTKKASYTVSVEGDIAADENVVVTPQNTVQLFSKNKQIQNALISQDKTAWKYSDFDKNANGTIEAKEITAGYWSGTFNFDINLESVKGDIILPGEDPTSEHTHEPANPVKENIVDATHFKTGSYDEVIYCNTCGNEISRIQKTIPKQEHTPSDIVIENKIDSTCEKEGSFEEVIYCSKDNVELSREKKTIPLKEHVFGEPVKENIKKATCEEDGSHDEVVYCKNCHKELKRTTIVEEHAGHSLQNPIIENKIEPTCDKKGSYDEVIKCSNCDYKIVNKKEIEKLAHTPGEFKVTKEATCEEDGIKEQTCDKCGEIIATETIPALGHKYGKWEDENGYQVRYCENDKSHKEIGSLTKYKLSFEDGFTDTDETNEILFTKEDEISLKPIYKDGYNFIGWKIKGNDDSQIITNIPKNTTHDVTVVAVWEPIKYEITYNLDGATNDNPNVYTIEDNFILKEPIKDGYTFIGWTGSNGKTPQKEISLPDANLGTKEYTANFELKNYNITYVLNGGEVSGNPENYNLNTSNITLNNPTKDGEEFLGWSGSNGVKPEKTVTIPTGTTGDLKYVAVFKPTKETFEKSANLIEPGLYKDEIIAPGSNPKEIRINEGTLFKPKWITKTVDVLKETRDKQRIYTWDELINNGYIEVNNGVVTATEKAKKENLSGKLFFDNSVTEIGDNAFKDWDKLNVDYIPNSVTRIGDNAFEKNKAMNGILLSNSVVSIGNEAFYDSQLKAIEIPNSTISIGDKTFFNCHELIKADIKEGLQHLGKFAFANTAITNVAIPSTLKTMGNSAFGDCDLLKTADIRCETISSHAFEDCTLLENVKIENVSKIGTSAFIRCVKLKTVEINNESAVKLKEIGVYAFSGCINLEEINLPDTITEIGISAFEYCKTLKTINLGNIKEIEADAFRDCSGLERVDIPNTVTSIGSESFENCINAEIYIPNSVISIQHDSFTGVKHIYYNGHCRSSIKENHRPWGAAAIN